VTAAAPKSAHTMESRFQIATIASGNGSIWAWRAGLPHAPVHALFARLGGTSLPPYGSLNLGLHTGDDPERVVANRRLAVEALGLSIDRVVAAEQVHGDRIAVVDGSDRGRGARDLATAVPGTDGLVTLTKGVVLFAFFADCLPVFLWDEAGKGIGLAHAGWKGTAKGVAARAVEALAAAGVPAGRLWAALGPCIGPCCYEVGEDVAEAFRKRFGPGAVKRARSNRVSVDLSEANAIELARAGVHPDRIIVSRACTSCRTDLFFSHRAEGPRTGRMAAVIAL